MKNRNEINRRDFLALAAGGTAGLLLGGRPAAAVVKAKPIVSESKCATFVPKSTVAVVQSSKPTAKALRYSDIKAMVTEAVELAGGFEGLIKDGQTVVLKPNIMCLWVRSTQQKLRPNINGVTTDWRVTKAVVELVRKYNPNGKVYVMESASFQQTRLAMDALNYTHKHIPGVDEFICLEDDSGGYEEWDSEKLVRITLPDGVGMYPDYFKAGPSGVFYMNKRYHDADVVISLAVLKNHTHAGITGALKNVGIGASPSNIYGTQEVFTPTTATPAIIGAKYGVRTSLIRTRKINHSAGFLDMWIHDYFLCRPVDFVVTDGLQGLQNGPNVSEPTKAKNLEENQMNMRLILAGRDAVSVDTIHSLIIGWDPEKVNHLMFLNNKGHGTIDSARIKVMGKKVHEVKKQFAMTFERGAVKRYTDFEPPEFTIKSAKIGEGRLDICLEANKEIAKVEVAVDGKAIEQIITDGFDNIALDVGQIKAGKHKIKVAVYDRYLNCTEKQVDLS